MVEVEWCKLKSADLRHLARRDGIAILPVAALEQHGPHLPVWVDTRLCSEIAIRGARTIAAREPVTVLPCVWHGLSEHHMPFGGTITLDYPTFHNVLRCVVRSLVKLGFRRVFILNGHGGNVAAMTVSVGELTFEFGIPVTTGTYWLIGQDAIKGILDVQSNVLHAGEAETSMMLALEPDLCDASNLEEARGPWSRADAEPAGPGVQFWRSFANRTPNGVIGEAATATAEKGEKLLNAYAGALGKVLTDPALWKTPA